jgi:ribosome-associated heat shock protein Hsp15
MAMDGQRLDKWLYCARLAKTRTGAARLIEEGKVRVNGVRALKPSRLVQPGNVVTATPSGRLRVVRVLAAAERRGPASAAQTLYEDLTPQAPREPGAAPGGDHRKGRRPTKRDRRRIDALRGGA